MPRTVPLDSTSYAHADDECRQHIRNALRRTPQIDHETANHLRTNNYMLDFNITQDDLTEALYGFGNVLRYMCDDVYNFGQRQLAWDLDDGWVQLHG